MDKDGTKINYADIQRGVDLLIQRFGMQKTLSIVQVLHSAGTHPVTKKTYSDLIMQFVISESERLFEVEQEPVEENKAYADARMAAYHLIKKYTNKSYAQIGKAYGQSKRAVIYHYNSCKEVLELPRMYRDFIETYTNLEENTLQFIAKLQE